MSDGANLTDSAKNQSTPSRKALLQYLVRIGSFTSDPKIPNEDTADEDVSFPGYYWTWEVLRIRCQAELSTVWRAPIQRDMVDVGDPIMNEDKVVRIMQWNILAQALAEGSDHFNCPPAALQWEQRRWRLLWEMIEVKPDILCLQEVDHFTFFQKALESIGYTGVFFPKPDSPCLYVPDNNGPDGCAVFVNLQRFELLNTKTRCLEIATLPTNQVAILCQLRRLCDDEVLWIATTHLKARTGSLMSSLRREQGVDFINFINSSVDMRTPVLITGDMNAGPSEAVHNAFTWEGFRSVYLGQEPSYTTWTIRDEGEFRDTLDYILYKNNYFYNFRVRRVLRVPTDEEIGPDRVPSWTYPSDHFALVADLELSVK